MDEPTSMLSLTRSLGYQDGAIVSRVLLKRAGGTVTLFAFDAGQELSEHSTPLDALLQVVEGEAEVRIGGAPPRLAADDLIHLPANVPHAVRATTRLTMLLVMLR